MTSLRPDLDSYSDASTDTDYSGPHEKNSDRAITIPRMLTPDRQSSAEQHHEDRYETLKTTL